MQCTTISDDKNLTVELLDFGARIHRVQFANTDVALHYSKISDYLSDAYYLGASIGPITNRIAGGKLSINGNAYQMPLNESGSCLHSGGFGFDKETWSVLKATKSSVDYQLVFNLSRIGLRGRLNIIASYRVENGALTIEYKAKTDTETYINPTNHVYLNLAGDGNIADHQFQILAKNYATIDEYNLPTGELEAINSPLDYQIMSSPLNEFFGLVDHHFNVHEFDGETLIPMLGAVSETSGISVLVSGNSPGFQFYTGKFLSTPFLPSAGFCLETQYAPDAINRTEFFSPLLAPGHEHQQITRFEFSDSNQ